MLRYFDSLVDIDDASVSLPGCFNVESEACWSRRSGFGTKHTIIVANPGLDIVPGSVMLMRCFCYTTGDRVAFWRRIVGISLACKSIYGTLRSELPRASWRLGDIVHRGRRRSLVSSQVYAGSEIESKGVEASDARRPLLSERSSLLLNWSSQPHRVSEAILER